jgi:glycosyltransferase involved in cell wall biosynthesis
MRLMFVITRGDEFGGAQMHVRDLVRRLAADGHNVHVVVGASGVLTAQLEAAGIPTSSCPGLLREIHPVHDIRAVRQLARMIRGFAPDLVTCHSSKAGIIGRLAARVAGVPCVFTVHGWAFIDTVRQPVRGAYKVLERGCAHLARRVVCVSNQVQQMGIDAGVDRSKLVVVHNGLPDVATPLRATPDSANPRAVMVARFASPKDHASVIRAMAYVPDLNLDFVGDGPEEDAAKELARDVGVTERIAFLGRRSDVDEILARSHIFVLSSLSEGFPISTLEAMRAGLPVVVSNVGGAGEAVSDRKTGFLFERANTEELADSLNRLAADAGLRASMGAAGRQLYEAEFTFERMYERTLSIYESALEIASQPSPVIEA